MKKILFVLCLFFATAAFAQSYSGHTLNNEVSDYSFSSHPAQATYSAMSTGSSLIAGASYGAAQGDRPASDFAQVDSVPLGTIAREYRKERAAVAQEKKSRVVWVNQ